MYFISILTSIYWICPHVQGVGEKHTAAIAAWLIPQLILAQAAKPGPVKIQGPAQAPKSAMQATGPASDTGVRHISPRTIIKIQDVRMFRNICFIL